MILYLTFGTGLSLLAPDSRQTLIEGTNRILEQASAMAHHMLEPKPSAPDNVVEFCNSTQGIIKSRIDNIYHALSSVRYPVHDFGESEPWQAKGIEHDRPFPDSRQLDSTVAPASEYSSTSDAARTSRQPHGSRPLTDSVTSKSPSEVEMSSSDSTALESTQASSKEFERDEFVRVWHHSGRWYRDMRIALIDTGSDENFIRGSLAEELELVTRRVRPVSLRPLGPRFEVSELVRPTWQFHGDSSRYQDYEFFVIPDIPGPRDMLLGDIARRELGIVLQQSRLALPVHEDYEGMFQPLLSRTFVIDGNHSIGPSTADQQQRLRERQERDATASQTKRRQDTIARHEEMVRKRATADAANRVEPQYPTLRRDAFGSNGNRG